MEETNNCFKPRQGLLKKEITMRISIIFPLVFLFSVVGFANTIHVPQDYPDIQQAIDASAAGDTVLVAPGTYVENIDFKGKGITVKGDQGPDFTTIDGGKSGTVVTFQSGEGSDSVLTGFTITNGEAVKGGGILCQNGSSPIITNNKIYVNQGVDEGGGVYCHESGPTIDNNIIDHNWSSLGGGISCKSSSTVIVSDNTFMHNTGLNGGGIHCMKSDLEIKGNLFDHNTGYAGGGGISCDEISELIVEENIFYKNSAPMWGAGVYSQKSIITIANNIFDGNKTSNYGGGISCWDSSSEITYNQISNNTGGGGGGVFCTNGFTIIASNNITDNIAQWKGGGILCWKSDAIIQNNFISKNRATQPLLSDGGGGIFCHMSSPFITNNTIIGNISDKNGGGISCFWSSLTTITNTVLWDNDAPVGPEIYMSDQSYPSNMDISYSDVEGGQASVYLEPNCTLKWGSGMIDSDPLFVDVAIGDLHISHHSPCRASGSNSAPVLPDLDFEGDPRIAYGTVDMGADEFHTHLYYTGEATAGGSVELKFVGLPGTAPVQVWLGSGVLENPMTTKYGDWYLQFPVLAQAGLGAIPTPGGVLVLPFTLPPSVPGTLYLPLQAGVGLELTNPCVMKVENP